jgi:hypothetical protein
MTTEKVSLSLPADLLDEARRWAAADSLSAYVARGLRRQVLADRRRQYLAQLDEEFGPLTEEEREEGRRLWNDEV